MSDYNNNFHLFATGNQPALTLTSAFLYATVQLCMTEQYRTHHQVLGLLSPGKAGMTVSNMPNNQIITSHNLICKLIKMHIHNSACNYEIQTASDTTISIKNQLFQITPLVIYSITENLFFFKKIKFSEIPHLSTSE